MTQREDLLADQRIALELRATRVELRKAHETIARLLSELRRVQDKVETILEMDEPMTHRHHNPKETKVERVSKTCSVCCGTGEVQSRGIIKKQSERAP